MDRRFNTTPLCLLLLPLILAGCSTAQSTYHTEGHAAHEIAKLSWFMTILFLVVTVVMWVLLIRRCQQTPRDAQRTCSH